MRIIQAASLVSLLLLLACKPVNEITVRNLSWMYSVKPSSNTECVTVNLNDSICHAYVILNQQVDEPRYNVASDTSLAGFRLKYILYKSLGSAIVVDSGSVINEFPVNRTGLLPVTLEFNFRAPKGEDYLLYIQATNLRLKQESVIMKDVLKRSAESAGWYLITDKQGGLVTTNCLESGDPLRIRYFGPACDKLSVKYFNHRFPPALPPFTMEMRDQFDYITDSSFRLPLVDGISGNIYLQGNGMYFFSCDSSAREGLPILKFYDGYPAIHSPGQMIEAVRYITTGVEYEKLMQSHDQKTAIDSFWVATGGNLTRGIELIRQYYGRVEAANRLFSSFCEGWKTDRGMIYIVFGEPNIVYRNGKQEEWIYGEARNYRSVHFMFQKVENPFTSKDYVLMRQPNFKEFWYMAVQQWRR